MLMSRFIRLFGGPSGIGLHTLIFHKTHYFSYMVHRCSTALHTVS